MGIPLTTPCYPGLQKAMRCEPSLVNFTLAAVILCLTESSFAQTNQARPTPPAQKEVTQPAISKFLPADSVLLKKMSISFEQHSRPDIVLAYAVPNSQMPPFVNGGVRVLRHGASGWALAFKESASVMNGAGPSDGISIERVTSADGKEAVVVVLKNSGAGTSTDWHLIAAVGGKFVTLDPTPIRDNVLKAREYVFMGYNGVTSKGDLVIEDMPGYSPGRARCCPDRPTIDVSFKFTGRAVKLDSVTELPFDPPAD
jgi:hypothetical protein